MTSSRLQTMLWHALLVWISSQANSIALRSMPRLIAFCIAETHAMFDEARANPEPPRSAKEAARSKTIIFSRNSLSNIVLRA
ncbi:hypothetical protein [Bradyrhizobium diazoefficiens]|uniref:hypothetical protein n=1 Tax=Bradyrhizobium diazoefficiens TaxID=1355477 RepID=UPI00272A2CB8|nr:hypothetical protein [Bradyrhizobium diazoefficiens]WLA67718.1 hypothetical protein QNN01_14205 [Bradyrhizobium diazoefficiens]